MIITGVPLIHVLHFKLEKLLEVLEHRDLIQGLGVVPLDVLLLFAELLDVLLLLHRLGIVKK